MRPWLLCLLLAGCAHARGVAPAAPFAPPVHTFSVVARDPATGELGVAVQSHFFNVGSVVPWAEAGVGAIATQASADPAYGPRGLALMRDGTSAPDALAALVAKDPNGASRQVAMIDVQGRVAAHTGARCIACAAHRIGPAFSVQANMMLNDAVVPAMEKAFAESTGPLADRLLATLDAAQAAGGDIRGQQSAALLVVRGTSTGRSWEDRLVDLRVEDHPAPLAELRRLLTLHHAYERSRKGDPDALALAPDAVELVFWRAVALVRSGDLEGAAPLLRKVFAGDSNWRELLRRLPPAGILTAEQANRALEAAK